MCHSGGASSESCPCPPVHTHTHTNTHTCTCIRRTIVFGAVLFFMGLAAAEPGGFAMGVKWLLESEFIVMLVPKP